MPSQNDLAWALYNEKPACPTNLSFFKNKEYFKKLNKAQDKSFSNYIEKIPQGFDQYSCG